MTATPSTPFSAEQPSWGSAATAPPAGSGSDTPAGSDGQPGARFFQAIRRLGVVRPDHGRWAAGVAAGLGRRWNVDPTVVRLGFVALTLFGGLGVGLYALGWLLLPHPDGRIHAQQALAGTVTAGFVGAALLLLLTTPHLYGPLLPLALIGLLIWHLGTHRQSQVQH